jgi:hypothetical protein
MCGGMYSQTDQRRSLRVRKFFKAGSFIGFKSGGARNLLGRLRVTHLSVDEIGAL